MINGEILIELNNDSRINVEKGLAKALLPQELEGLKKHDSEITGVRDYDIAYKERIKILRKKGLLVVKNTDGGIKFDDRKLRFSRLSLDDVTPTIYVAPSTYGEMETCDNSALSDKKFFNRLTEMGNKNYNDAFAYFASCFAVNGVPITNEGYIHIFKRGTKTNDYPGYWHVIGGMLDMDFELFNQGDPGENLLNNANLCMKKEYFEETGVKKIDLSLTGMTRNIPGTVDFNYIANLPMSSAEFLKSTQTAKDGWEHTDNIILKSKGELKGFLDQTEKIPPSGRGGLELYLRQKS